ncbi:MAG: ABC-F family ATP-binding cassette domain-containing protein, partial [Bacteroidales bacterium]|nr:ABC-F family ATP-binding cassette domain-containing protein [Bacteroidales bacterium]
MIAINNVTVSYGGFTLLDNIDFHISETDKVGLVGKNGAGKSTLMKLIVGEQSPTSGHIEMPADIQIGYLPQIMEHHRGRSVIDEVMTVFDHLHEMERELDRINMQLAERTDYESADYAKLIDRLNEINDRLALETGESPRVQAEKTLFGLGFKEDELERKTETFSQGWNMRIELAKILLSQPDVLL